MEFPPIVRASSGTVTDYRLRTSYRRLHPDIWIRRDLELDATTRAVAAWAWSRQRATLTGYSAAAIWGAKYLPSTADAELVIANRSRPPNGITIRRRVVLDDEQTVRRGFCVTVPLRTAFDLCRDLPESDAVGRRCALSGDGHAEGGSADVLPRDNESARRGARNSDRRADR